MALLLSRCFVVGSPLAACKGWGTGLSPFLPRPALLTSPLTRKRNGENSCHRRLAVQCRNREQVEGTLSQRGQSKSCAGMLFSFIAVDLLRLSQRNWKKNWRR